MGLYEDVKVVAEMALRAFEAENTKHVSARELLDWAKENRSSLDVDIDAIAKSWGAYLTKASNDEDSLIKRETGKYGYVLRESNDDSVMEAEPENTEEIPTSEQKKNEQRERPLYDIMVEWLKAQDMRARDTSSSTKGGQWGNPDVIGIRLHDHVLGGAENIEVVSIEAKTGLNNWRREFFEAVSHKRFVHRAFFAFAQGSDEARVNDIPDYHELRKYGERFGVGVLVVFLLPEAYHHLTTGTKVIEVSLDEWRVEEIWPAVFDEPAEKDMHDFLRDVLKLDRPTKVRDFGSGLE